MSTATKKPRERSADERTLELLFGLAANANQDVATDLEEALLIATEHLGMRTGLIVSVAADRLFVEHAYRPFAGIEAGTSLPVVESCLHRAVESLTAIGAGDLTLGDATETVEARTQRAFLAAPVVVDGSAYGAVAFFDPEPRTGGFDRAAQTFAMRIARWIGATVTRGLRERRRVGDDDTWRAVLAGDAAGVAVLEPVPDDAGGVHDFRWRFLNPAALRAFAERHADPVGKRLLETAPEARNSGLLDLLTRVADGEAPEREEIFLPGRRPADRGVWLRVAAMPLGADLLVSLEDVTAEKGAGAETEAQTRLDPETGLRNRAFFDAEAGRRLAEARRQGRAAGLVVVRLAGLEALREAVGQEAAATLVAMAARRLERTLRPSDIVTRFDTDTFAVLPRLARPDAAARIAERVTEMMAIPFIVEGEEADTDLRVGWVLADDDEPPAGLVFRALRDAAGGGGHG